jgi:hypothetical protein
MCGWLAVLRLRKRPLAFLELAEDLFAEGKIGSGLVGRGQAARGSVEQPHAEMAFQIDDVARHQGA